MKRTVAAALVLIALTGTAIAQEKIVAVIASPIESNRVIQFNENGDVRICGFKTPKVSGVPIFLCSVWVSPGPLPTNTSQ